MSDPGQMNDVEAPFAAPSGDGGGCAVVPPGAAAVPTWAPDAALRRWLFEDHPQAILIYDIERLTILDVNAAFTLVSGYDRDDVVGRPLASLLVPDDLPAMFDTVETLVRPEHARHRDGSW